MTNDDSSPSSNTRAKTSIASTAPGIPDDALAPGEQLPVPPSDEEVAAMARKLGAPIFQDAGAD